LTQHVKSPTRLDAVLDLVITSEPDLVHEVEATAPLESSDHNMISWKCRVETSQNPTRLTRLNYKKANMDAIRAELQQIDWDLLLDGDIHSSWSNFRNVFWGLESKHIPVASSSTKRRHRPIWMTNKVQKLLTKKRRTFSKYRSNTHPACKKSKLRKHRRQ